MHKRQRYFARRWLRAFMQGVESWPVMTRSGIVALISVGGRGGRGRDWLHEAATRPTLPPPLPRGDHQPHCMVYHVFSLSLRDVELLLAERGPHMKSIDGPPIASMINWFWRIAYRIGFRAARFWWWLRRPDHHDAVVAIWLNERILVVQQSYRTNLSWPGGGIHRGEHPRDAAHRELAEELGLMVKPDLRVKPRLASFG